MLHVLALALKAQIACSMQLSMQFIIHARSGVKN